MTSFLAINNSRRSANKEKFFVPPRTTQQKNIRLFAQRRLSRSTARDTKYPLGFVYMAWLDASPSMLGKKLTALTSTKSILLFVNCRAKFSLSRFKTPFFFLMTVPRCQSRWDEPQSIKTIPRRRSLEVDRRAVKTSSACSTCGIGRVSAR